MGIPKVVPPNFGKPLLSWGAGRSYRAARGDGGVPDKDWGLRAQGVQGFGVRVKSLKFWV